MIRLEDIAAAALEHRAMDVRSLLQDFLRAPPDWTSLERPSVDEPRVLAVAAAFAELLAHRSNQEPPAWTREVGPLVEPVFLVAAAARLPRTRARIEAESPEPFKRRNIFVPAEYASAA